MVTAKIIRHEKINKDHFEIIINLSKPQSYHAIDGKKHKSSYFKVWNSFNETFVTPCNFVGDEIIQKEYPWSLVGCGIDTVIEKCGWVLEV